MNLINMGSLEMNIKECATFLSGGSATFKMLKETIILRMKIDAKESKGRFRVIVSPMDMVIFLLRSIMILLCFVFRCQRKIQGDCYSYGHGKFSTV